MIATLRRPAAAAATLAAAGAIALAGAQGAVAGPKAAPRPAEHPLSAVTMMNECVAHNGTNRPRAFTLTCADANQRLDAMTWRNWGTKAATGVGVVRENTCKPNCAQGTFTTYRVRVVADRLVNREATQAYTRLTVRYLTPRPGNAPRVEVYRLPR